MKQFDALPFLQPTPEWIEAPGRLGITASEVGAACGVGRFGGPFDVFSFHRGLRPDLIPTQAMIWGTILEEPVAQYGAAEAHDHDAVSSAAARTGSPAALRAGARDPPPLGHYALARASPSGVGSGVGRRRSPSAGRADAAAAVELGLGAPELGDGLVAVDPLARDPVPVGPRAQLGEHG